jgi:hypothetical protein
MRGYLAVTPDELVQLLEDNKISIDTAFVPTSQFKSSNPELGEEESEYILSLLAAEDSISYQEDSAKFSFVLAVDLVPSQVGEESDVEVTLLSPIEFSQVDCLFVGDANTDDGELTWYAAQEIAIQLPNWQAK